MGRFGLQPETALRLADLDDDELVRRIIDARETGKLQIANEALGILIYRRSDDVLARVRLKVPEGDAKDVAQEAMFSGLKASFDGRSMGQFVNLLHTITDRRIADHHRKQEKSPGLEPLPDENRDDDDVWGRTPSVSDQTGEVAVQMVYDEQRSRLSEPHGLVVDLCVDGNPASRTAAIVNVKFENQLKTPMTEDNVNQIISRFRRELRTQLSVENGAG